MSPCLHTVDSNAYKIIETDASEIGYRGILKQKKNNTEQKVQNTSKYCNKTQQHYSTVKNGISSIVLCIIKFQKRAIK